MAGNDNVAYAFYLPRPCPIRPSITPVTEDIDSCDMTLDSDGGKRQRRLCLLPTDRGVHLAACHGLQRAGAARWRRLALSPSSLAPRGTSLLSFSTPPFSFSTLHPPTHSRDSSSTHLLTSLCRTLASPYLLLLFLYPPTHPPLAHSTPDSTPRPHSRLTAPHSSPSLHTTSPTPSPTHLTPSATHKSRYTNRCVMSLILYTPLCAQVGW